MCKYVKWINDNIHGAIGLTQEELGLVDTPVFQRLRRIRQLSLVHLVFPTAEHSRFAHSLGVLALANKIAQQLFELGELDKESLRIARLTALLHDIGHLPWSHLGEQAYDAYMSDKENLGGSLDLEAIDLQSNGNRSSDHILNRLANYSPARKIHEHIGAHLIRNHPDLQKYLRDDAEIIGGILEKSDLVEKSGGLQLIRSIISSALDADRLDYLIRDSYSTGVRYGLVDADFLIRNIRVGEDRGQKILGVREEALAAAEHFLFSRLFHYTQVVHHKNVTAFEAVARALLYRMIERNFLPGFECEEEIYDFAMSEDWYTFDDEHIMALVRQFANDGKSDDLDRALAETIVNRKRPIIVCEMRDLCDREYGPREHYYQLRNWVATDPGEIAELLGVPETFVSYTESRVRIDSIQSRYGLDILMNEKDSLIHEAADALKLISGSRQWRLAVSSEDSFLRLVADYERYTLRIFCLESDKYAVDPERLEMARRRIKQNFPRAIVKFKKRDEGKAA